MIFAAGFGTRMRPLTADRPKPLLAVQGVPLIDHALALADAAACVPIVVNLHYKAEMLLAHLAGTRIKTIVEAPDILETGGGLRNALPALGQSTVMTLNPDVIWNGPNVLSQLASAWDPVRMDALLSCVPLSNALGRSQPGDFSLDAAGKITRGGGLVYGGAQIIKTDILSDIPETVFSLNVAWDLLAAKGRLHGLAYPGQWCDVGTPDGIGLAETMLGAHHA